MLYFLYSLIHSFTKHFRERINYQLKRKRKFLGWNLRTEYSLILYLSSSWVRVTVPCIRLKVFPLSPRKPPCQMGTLSDWGGVAVYSSPVVQCKKDSVSTTGDYVIFESGQNSIQVPAPVYLLSYGPRPSAGHRYHCNCLHCTIWFHSTFCIISWVFFFHACAYMCMWERQREREYIFAKHLIHL